MAEIQKETVLENEQDSSEELTGFRRVLQKIGPGLILAAATIGPGSVVTAAVIGSQYRYALIWVVVAAIIIRALYSKAMFSSSLVLKMPMLDAIRHFYGPSIAVLTAVTCIMGSIAFQIGNFAGTGTGAELLFPLISWKLWGIVITAVAIWLIYSRDVYNRVEMVMKVVVATMVISFAATLFAAGGPSVGGTLSGLVPKIPNSGAMVIILALLASTVSLTGVAYGTYLGREKKWTTDDIKEGNISWDIGISVGSIGLITILIMLTGAVVLFPKQATVSNIKDLIDHLIPVIGPAAKYLIGVGFFAAAISSMIVNAQVGSTLFLAGIGKPSTMESKEVRALASGILIFGCLIGFLVGKAPVQLMIAANAATVINTPLLGLFAILIVSRKEMGVFRASTASTVALFACYAAIIVITVNNIIKLLGSLGLS